MEDICRLCCSTNFVNNHIFDEENALYLKMSLYLPIKVFKNDRLPQKICDKCSCKVNDFYQFCNETIEVQNRLRAVLISTAVEIEDSVDLTTIKENDQSPFPAVTAEHPNISFGVHKVEPHTDHEHDSQMQQNRLHGSADVKIKIFENRAQMCEQGTQTDVEPPVPQTTIPIPSSSNTKTEPVFQNVKVKEEPKVMENLDEITGNLFMSDGDMDAAPQYSDVDENKEELTKVKKKRKKKTANGDVEKKKRKPKLQEWEMLIRALPEGTALTVVDPEPGTLASDVAVKKEPDEDLLSIHIGKLKQEPVDFHCCICFMQCYSRTEMLQHYKEHARESEEWSRAPPAAPPAPDTEPLKCPRCQKRLERSQWAAHWLRHWERDRRPYRCALCEKTFRDHHQILKHGMSHKLGEEETAANAGEKRYVCDICPEGFVHMRFLLAHRTRAHPEAAGRALLPRCARCHRQFAHLNSLRRHLHAHSGERNFLCNICGKALSSREHLKFHIRIHTGYKPNVCKTCGKGFVKKCNLTLHERVHSGEKPHVCSHCGKAFSQRSTLVIHERYHSGARPYVCGLCGRGFVAKGLLSMHLKTTCI